MRTLELKVTRIGNSRGVRLPAATLRRYHVGSGVLMEERADGIFLHPKPVASEKLSWEETARQMAESHEDWSGWEIAAADGLDVVPWDHKAPVVTEARETYESAPCRRRSPRKRGRS